MAILPVDKSSGTFTNFARAQAITPGPSLPKITVTGTSAASETFATGTNLIRVYNAQNCWVVFDTDAPAAVADDTKSFFVIGGIAQFFGVPEGATKLHVIRDTVSGTLHVLQGRV